jgi:hypothetical protein
MYIKKCWTAICRPRLAGSYSLTSSIKLSRVKFSSSPLLVLSSLLSSMSASPQDALFTPTLVYQFPNNGSWIENLAERPDGQLLFTRSDDPNLYLIDPKSVSAKLVHLFPDANGLTRITEIKSDVYAVASLYLNLMVVIANNSPANLNIPVTKLWIGLIWKVEFTSGEA